MNIEKLKETVEFVGKGISPKGDWMPTLIAEGGKEPAVIIGFEMVEGTKNKVAKAITETCRTQRATSAAFVTTGWVLDLSNMSKADQAKAMKDGENQRINTRPDKVECVQVVFGNRNGSGKPSLGILLGRVIRSKSHPKIEWIHEYPAHAEVGGRFPDALREGLSW